MPKIIQVIPNPYIALDKDGVPQGVVGAGMPGIFIGAQIDLFATRKAGKPRFYYPPDKKGGLAKKVHLTGDVVTAVHAGELLAADKESAAACGLTEKEFLEPAKALEAERKKALDWWQAHKGSDGKGPNLSATIQDIPREATSEKEGETAPIQTASVQLTPTVKLAKQEG